MAASTMSSSENLFAGKSDQFEAMGALNIDEAFLVSLLEESQVEEAEEERLGFVMRSLEAEIDPKVTVRAPAGPATGPELGGVQCISEAYLSEDSRLDDNGFDWLDMEMTSSPLCDDMGSWYMDTCAYDQLEFAEVRDYDSHLYYTAPVEEQAYSPLWQQTYDSVMYY